MKVSKYNIYLTHNDSFYVFNQLSSSLSQIDKELYYALKEEKISEITSQECLNELYDSNFICDKLINESNIVLAANKTYRFSKDFARVTILPTINCNFNCWYCYESHVESVMSIEAMESTFLFCKNLIEQNNLKEFHLDWFGGEPFMYFEEIMYPLSLRIKHICNLKNITFRHTVTTNGYLISPNVLRKIKEIDLKGFQITLDGSEFFHNKTRFIDKNTGSYQTIVENIIFLCRNIENITMTVRVNYTPKNLSTIDKIAYSFPEDVRNNIFIEPQQVWQFKDMVNTIDDTIKIKLSTFNQMGYKTRGVFLPKMVCGCYVENMLQYVINYDLSVYKCTARDFLSKKTSIGTINKDGEFIPNFNYYNYFISSFMENEKCLACNILPLCSGMCIQKKIENSMPKCPYERIRKSIENQLMLILTTNN